MDLDSLKSLACREVDTGFPGLRALALKIHASPELGFQESKAAGWLAGYLESHGFAVEKGVYGLATAFKAVYGNGRPAIAFLAEYDALPDIGHACGHNLIAGSAVGAAVATKKAVEGLGGSVVVFGTPAEELYGGKAVMARQGAFEDIDVAMMVHPETIDAATTMALACQGLDVEFIGRAAHAAARPDAGINALEAMILSFNAIDSLRQHIKTSARVHGIITDGGQAANIVPARSAGSFLVRAADDAYLEELKAKVLDCFSGAALATGAELKYRWADTCYATMLSNGTLARLFARNMETVGRKVALGAPRGFGSTDMGNVSHLVPAIHPYVAIAPPGTQIHSPDFARASASEEGIAGMRDAAKALAMTAVDLLGAPEVLAEVKTEFERSR